MREISPNPPNNQNNPLKRNFDSKSNFNDNSSYMSNSYMSYQQESNYYNQVKSPRTNGGLKNRLAKLNKNPQGIRKSNLNNIDSLASNSDENRSIKTIDNRWNGYSKNYGYNQNSDTNYDDSIISMSINQDMEYTPRNRQRNSALSQIRSISRKKGFRQKNDNFLIKEDDEVSSNASQFSNNKNMGNSKIGIDNSMSGMNSEFLEEDKKTLHKQRRKRGGSNIYFEGLKDGESVAGSEQLYPTFKSVKEYNNSLVGDQSRLGGSFVEHSLKKRKNNKMDISQIKDKVDSTLGSKRRISYKKRPNHNISHVSNEDLEISNIELFKNVSLGFYENFSNSIRRSLINLAESINEEKELITKRELLREKGQEVPELEEYISKKDKYNFIIFLFLIVALGSIISNFWKK